MHHVSLDGLMAVDITKYGVKSGDAVIFAFGEIDVRCHIGKQRDLKNRDLDEIIQALAQNYLKAIAQNCTGFPHIIPIVYSITPPTDVVNNPDFPSYGELKDRVNITKRLNALLKSLCCTFQIKFLDVYDDYADENGALRAQLSDGNVHINHASNEYIRRKLYQILYDPDILKP
jgi:lysophospholipase L1-like esterase